ncbi:nitrilase-related carbon-nitrogen hydrolase [Peribacillus simplex]|uniref:nitrilase-related carbon-nitrogen hydrolase n=1 Tax=Peribacillus simplex TaxID=1478 RepID=UPI003D2B1176
MFDSVSCLAIQARAQENQMFVATANRVGQLEETSFCGESAVVDPYGWVIAEAGRGEEVLSASIDLSLGS